MFKDRFHSRSCPDQVERARNSSPGRHPDNFKMSYYGETSVYLVSITGNFGYHVARDPSTTLLGVPIAKSLEQCKLAIISFPFLYQVFLPDMSDKTMAFDLRVHILHDFGSAPHNTISFNPQSRLLFLAGFGNLTEKVDVFGRHMLNKVCSISAPNTFYCS